MNAATEQPLLIDERDGVAWLTMNRPERLNALNRGLTDALRTYFQALEDRPDIRVVGLRALQAEAQALVEQMLNATPLALRLTKDCLNQNIDAQGLRAAIAMEDRNQVLCTRGGDFGEGIRAFLEKRKPVYGQTSN